MVEEKKNNFRILVVKTVSYWDHMTSVARGSLWSLRLILLMDIGTTDSTTNAIENKISDHGVYSWSSIVASELKTVRSASCLQTHSSLPLSDAFSVAVHRTHIFRKHNAGLQNSSLSRLTTVKQDYSENLAILTGMAAFLLASCQSGAEK